MKKFIILALLCLAVGATSQAQSRLEHLTVKSEILGVEKAYSVYTDVAASLGAELSPATVCFMNILENHPDAPLHAEDMAHPSLLGSCVIATALYRTLIGAMPTEYSSVECARPYFDIIDSIVEEYGK